MQEDRATLSDRALSFREGFCIPALRIENAGLPKPTVEVNGVFAAVHFPKPEGLGFRGPTSGMGPCVEAAAPSSCRLLAISGASFESSFHSDSFNEIVKLLEGKISSLSTMDL